MAELISPDPFFNRYLESPQIREVAGQVGLEQNVIEQDEQEGYIKMTFGPGHLHEAFVDASGTALSTRDRYLSKHPSTSRVVVKGSEIPIEVHEEWGPMLRFYINNQSSIRQEIVRVGFQYGQLSSVAIIPTRIPQLPPLPEQAEEVQFFKQAGKWYYRLLNVGSMVAKEAHFDEEIISPLSGFSYQIEESDGGDFQLISKQPATNPRAQISITTPNTVDIDLWHNLLWTEGKDWRDVTRNIPVHTRMVQKAINYRRRR